MGKDGRGSVGLGRREEQSMEGMLKYFIDLQRMDEFNLCSPLESCYWGHMDCGERIKRQEDLVYSESKV